MQSGTENDIAERDRVRRAVEQMSHAVAVFDGALNLVFINGAAVDLLQLPPDMAAPGTSMRDFVFCLAKREALDVDDFEAEYRRRINSPRLQMEFVRDDDAIIRLHREPLDNGGFVVTYSDVTEQRRAEAALQHSEMRYRSIVEDQTEQIMRCNPDGIVTFANGACCEFHGIGRAAIVGSPMRELVHENDRDAVMAFFGRDRPSQTPREIEHRARRGDGEVRWLHRRDRAILDRDGAVVEFQSVAQDVTDMRAVESQIRRASALAILGQMSAGVTHELNQPLNAVSMIIQTTLMQMEDMADPAMDEFRVRLDKAHSQLTRMGGIVNHLRSFIQSDGAGHVCMDLASLLDTSIDIVRHQLLIDRIDAEIDLPASLPPVHGDTVQLEIVFANLLSNAHAAILRRRREGTSGTPPSARGRIAVSARQRADTVEVTVADDGGGIRPEIIDRIFDPFFTTQTVGRGMGLGLSLVYRIVSGLNGSVKAANRAKGAVFTVTLPVANKAGLP